MNPLRGGTFQTLGGAGVASVSSSGDSQMGSGKSIQQQKHEYYTQEGKYVYPSTAFEAALRENRSDGRAQYLAVMDCHHMATQIRQLASLS